MEKRSILSLSNKKTLKSELYYVRGRNYKEQTLRWMISKYLDMNLKEDLGIIKEIINELIENRILILDANSYLVREKICNVYTIIHDAHYNPYWKKE